MNRNRLQNSAFWVVLAAAVAYLSGGCDSREPPGHDLTTLGDAARPG